ncbi:MAG: RNA-binding S4 domain-containing protein [Oscillospiraceae bacterium]|jgi:ribosome-associated protein|nr:RNA-binding S4 domain-containing protein [Oscillospiraceae bacterium]
MTRERVVIRTSFIKLDALLKFCGAAGTGGHAKAMIQSGSVFLDGNACLERGKKIYTGMVVSVDGKEYEVVSG